MEIYGRGKFYLSHYKFRLGASLVPKVILETFTALWNICRNQTRDDRTEISEHFEDTWNVPKLHGRRWLEKHLYRIPVDFISIDTAVHNFAV